MVTKRSSLIALAAALAAGTSLSATERPLPDRPMVLPPDPGAQQRRAARKQQRQNKRHGRR